LHIILTTDNLILSYIRNKQEIMVCLRKYFKSSDKLNEINRYLNEENANRYEVLQSIVNEYIIFDDLYLSQGACFWYISSFSNDKIIGTIGVKKVSYEAVEIKRFYVNIKYRRKNLGKALFYNALDFTLKHGYKKMLKFQRITITLRIS